MAACVSNSVYEWNIALEELRHVTSAFTRADIVHVEAHWSFYDLTSWSSGYVVGLKDGRRAYIEYVRYLDDDEECVRVMIEFLEAAEPYPARSTNKDMGMDWDHDAEELTEALTRVPANDERGQSSVNIVEHADREELTPRIVAIIRLRDPEGDEGAPAIL